MPKRLASVNDFSAPSTSTTIGPLTRSGIRRRSAATTRTSGQSVRLSSLNLRSESNDSNENTFTYGDPTVWPQLPQAENSSHQVQSDRRDEGPGCSEPSSKPLPALPPPTDSPTLSSMLEGNMEYHTSRDEPDYLTITSLGNISTFPGAENLPSFRRSHSHSSTGSTPSASTISSLPTPDFWGHIQTAPDYFHISHIQHANFAPHEETAQFLKAQSRAESFKTATSATLIPSRKVSTNSKYLDMRSKCSSSTDWMSARPTQLVFKSVEKDGSRSQKRHHRFSQSSDRKPKSTSQALEDLLIDHDVNYYTLPPAIHRKLTHKWPAPRFALDANKSMGKLESARASAASEQWTPHKWCLMLSVSTAFVYGIVGMGFVIATWSNGKDHWWICTYIFLLFILAWQHADVTLVTSPDILTLATLLSILLLLAACLGGAGTLLKSRQLLALYTLLLIPSLIALLSIGYIAYKRANFAPASKISFAWSRHYTQAGRLVIQNSLGCCGLDDPEHDGVLSQQCYPRSMLEGCKVALWSHEVAVLSEVYTTLFAVLLPVHLLHIVAALLCVNHVDERFGKGIMPKQYWLSEADVSEAWSDLRKHTNQNVVRTDIDTGDRFKRRGSQINSTVACPRRVWAAPNRTHSWIEKNIDKFDK